MNGAKDGLAVLGQSVDEVQDRPGGLGVKTGGRLVQEQKQLGFGSKLDTDGQALALLDIETCGGLDKALKKIIEYSGVVAYLHRVHRQWHQHTLPCPTA